MFLMIFQVSDVMSCLQSLKLNFELCLCFVCLTCVNYNNCKASFKQRSSRDHYLATVVHARVISSHTAPPESVLGKQFNTKGERGMCQL